jgi:hypothetical protein
MGNALTEIVRRRDWKMQKTLNAYHDMVITFPENVNNYKILRFNIKSNKKLFRKRKSFFMKVFDSEAELLKFRKTIDSDSCGSDVSYNNDVKYDENRVIYIFNTNNTSIDISISLQCYSEDEYNNRNKYEHVTAVTGI